MAFLPYLTHLPILLLFRSKLRGNALFLIINLHRRKSNKNDRNNAKTSRERTFPKTQRRATSAPISHSKAKILMVVIKRTLFFYLRPERFPRCLRRLWLPDGWDMFLYDRLFLGTLLLFCCRSRNPINASKRRGIILAPSSAKELCSGFCITEIGSASITSNLLEASGVVSADRSRVSTAEIAPVGQTSRQRWHNVQRDWSITATPFTIDIASLGQTETQATQPLHAPGSTIIFRIAINPSLYT